MKKLCLSCLITLYCLGLPAQILAQEFTDSLEVWLIETNDGNVFNGHILERNEKEIQLKTQTIGIITIQIANIKIIRKLNEKEIRSKGIWLENTQATRYFFTPNAYGLRRGEGYYQNSWIFLNNASIGITNHFSMGLGLVPLFIYGAPTPVWITPKVSIPVVKDKFNLGVGGLFGTSIGAEETGFGIVYGVTTFGSRDRNLTVGLGYGFSGEGFAEVPTITL